MKTRVPALVALALIGFFGVESCRADLIISQYAANRNDRYYTGPGRAFVADGFDLSGVGKNTANPVTSMNTNVRWADLISPHFALSSAHFAPLPGETVTFVAGNTPGSPTVTATVAAIETIGGPGQSDLELLRFSTAVTGVTSYAIVQDDAADRAALIHDQIYVYGQSNRVGTNNIDTIFGVVSGPGMSPTYSYLYDYNTTNGNPNEARVNNGDSGAPSFVVGVDGKLALVGTHSFQYDAQTGFPLPGSGDTYVPHYLPQIIARVNALDAQFGYTDQVRTIHVWGVPEPSGLALMGIGLGGLALARRLTRASRSR